VTIKPRIENGYLLLPEGPGWGTEVNEEAVRAHPPALEPAAAAGRCHEPSRDDRSGSQ